ncbi:hypothetical protein B0H63DRAFT_207965 [Podospora didyma]|uniref:Uncharacterized protein n=1 Tax=Podospora didyma TaxID=330526 RepID=A0AAE0NHD2_9PEZI|nr:hypothetical protein B0H63DRAFT_207965 [Podospora didyma]
MQCSPSNLLLTCLGRSQGPWPNHHHVEVIPASLSHGVWRESMMIGTTWRLELSSLFPIFSLAARLPRPITKDQPATFSFSLHIHAHSHTRSHVSLSQTVCLVLVTAEASFLFHLFYVSKLALALAYLICTHLPLRRRAVLTNAICQWHVYSDDCSLRASFFQYWGRSLGTLPTRYPAYTYPLNIFLYLSLPSLFFSLSPVIPAK